MKNQTHWKPYVPSASNPWNLDRVEHLHRRLGFGATRAELQRDLAAGFVKTIERFLSPLAREATADPVPLHKQARFLASQAIQSNRIRLLQSAS